MELEKILRTDFSHEASHKQETLNGLLETNENDSQAQKHERVRKVVKKRKTAVIVAACLTLLLSITAMAYKGNAWRVVKEVTLGGYAKYNTMEQDSAIAIPAELEGKLFDENGNVLTVYPEDGRPMYTESGEKVDYIDGSVWEDENGGQTETTIVTEAEAPLAELRMFTNTRSVEKAKQYIMFDFTTPDYLPEGYNNIMYRMFNGEDGRPYPDCKYLVIEYKNKNGDLIYCQMRYMDEETAYEASLGIEFSNMDVNGHEAAVSDQSVDIEIDGIMYMFVNHTIGRDELIKIASSIQ